MPAFESKCQKQGFNRKNWMKSYPNTKPGEKTSYEKTPWL